MYLIFFSTSGALLSLTITEKLCREAGFPILIISSSNYLQVDEHRTLLSLGHLAL